MQLTCPHCGFSKQIATEQLSPTANRAHCPQCYESFPLKRAETNRLLEPEPLASVTASGSTGGLNSLPKAGFWIRLAAWFIDKMLIVLLETVLGTLLFLAGIVFIPESKEAIGSLVQLIWFFTTLINIVYYVLFTGHGGQTPGKMAVRIKVIRCDGQPVSYGRAFFRELPGKFVSAVILGIGYLMVAFDEQKQGLHDRMADTYVIKL